MQLHCRYIIGDITDQTPRSLGDLPIIDEPLLVVIDSPGGILEAAFAVAAFLNYTDQSTALVTGKADSSAIVVLQACKHRVMLDTASIFFHSSGFTKRFRNLDAECDKKMQAYREERLASQALYDKAVARRSKVSPEEIRELCRKEKRLSATEALHYGFVDKVVTIEKLLQLKILFPTP